MRWELRDPDIGALRAVSASIGRVLVRLDMHTVRRH
jgi:hypothetical protein